VLLCEEPVGNESLCLLKVSSELSELFWCFDGGGGGVVLLLLWVFRFWK
jgi:hypothetical protein